MQYYSTNGKNQLVSLYDAVTQSIASDGGVYMPYSIPFIPKALFNNISEMSLTDIAYVAGTSLFGSDIGAEEINSIVKETLNFPIPLVKISERIYSLELFHGPTGSFKDIGARFMAKVIEHFVHTGELSNNRQLNILVATSGDTGAAVADAFADIPGVKTFIFHPKDKIIKLRNNIISISASNIIPVEIRGTFDECQQLVKLAYADKELNKQLNLTSANSLNIARLLPQTFYYFYAYAQIIALTGVNSPNISIATPCGNLGNLTAALFAKQMGLPITRIMAAGHGLDRLWGDMREGALAVNTFNSRALSTNLSRINEIIRDTPYLAKLIDCHTYNGDEIDSKIRLMYDKSKYLMDRNTAMACKALTENIAGDEIGVFLATAHPWKYRDRIKELTGADVPSMPTHAKTITTQTRHTLSATFPAVRKFLLDNN